ncbi:DNA-binding PadR family transcriptional regulator [Kibdelosporangium banguiense]|uniref:DNA-binding PadR family transcriptional regulator n=1 Tax=Kibdelosporangium banguiense TaxID=1365924 RepID=A0ABS4TM02_9PSEU|nr:PadR family transcriptional regulator [Kibdelosporangium banguiense]MBP2325443.1 DNA-binding PadR family transcriptional regulator [Kibdelosporangium banguiense]
MALRHAVLAALVDRELSGYQLAKLFDLGVSSFWHAASQQLYVELGKLEADGLLTGHEVVQQGRPNKRVFALTETGRAELRRFTDAPTKPTSIRDDLLVKAYAAHAAEPANLAGQLEQRAAQCQAKADYFQTQLAKLRGDQPEAEYLATAQNIGPYLAGTRGLRYAQEEANWCTWAAATLRARS